MVSSSVAPLLVSFDPAERPPPGVRLHEHGARTALDERVVAASMPLSPLLSIPRTRARAQPGPCSVYCRLSS